MKKSVIIIIPSLKPTSPIKGAFALANILIKYTNVSIVPLNSSPKSSELISDPKLQDIAILASRHAASADGFHANEQQKYDFWLKKWEMN